MGTITILSLILHNILEGFAIFGMAINDFKVGILIAVSVGLHNVPLGMHIFSTLNIKENKKQTFLLAISSLIGGIIFLIVGNISNLIIGIITAITIGMLIYISLWELLPELKTTIKKKESLIGLGIGLLIILISLFI